VSWLGWWVTLMALWIVLVGTFDPAELGAGVVAAALGATLSVAVLFRGADRFDGDARWLLRAWRLPWQSVVDTVKLTAALSRQVARREEVRSAFRVLPFEHGGTGSRDVARRACAKAAGSVAANVYVVGIDEERDVVLYHELVRTEGRTACDPLELG
jgi:hypothetical protein